MFVYMYIIVYVGRVVRRPALLLLSSPLPSLPSLFHSTLSSCFPRRLSLLSYPSPSLALSFHSLSPSVPAPLVRLSRAASHLTFSSLVPFYSHKWSDKSGYNESTNSRDRGLRVHIYVITVPR